MLGLDITTNTDYVDQGDLQVWGIMASQVYTYTVSYKTLVDEKWTANEQRRAQWQNPRRTWRLSFRKNAEVGKKFEEFFKANMGKFRAFKFKWSAYYEGGDFMGGDDKWYYVRFKDDELQINVDYLGYRTFDVTLIELRNGA